MLYIDLTVCVFGQVSELYRTGRLIKRIDRASSDEQADRFVKLQLHRATQRSNTTEQCVWNRHVCVCVTDRCRSVVETFLSLDLEDTDLDLQHFMKEELLPSAGSCWTAAEHVSADLRSVLFVQRRMFSAVFWEVLLTLPTVSKNMTRIVLQYETFIILHVLTTVQTDLLFGSIKSLSNCLSYNYLSYSNSVKLCDFSSSSCSSVSLHSLFFVRQHK